MQRCRRGSCGKDVHCGMKSEHLVGTSIPRFTYDTPTVPGNDFYALCEGEHPLCMIFLPGFDHPVSREYITRYLKTLPQLKGARLVCVVRSSAQAVAKATHGSDFPFPVICDGPGVLYGYLGVEQTRGLLSWRPRPRISPTPEESIKVTPEKSIVSNSGMRASICASISRRRACAAWWSISPVR